MCEGRAECESQQQNKRDGGQSPVGDRGALTLFGGGLEDTSNFNSVNVTAGAIIPKVPVENSPAPARWCIPALTPSGGGAVRCYGEETCTKWNK